MNNRWDFLEVELKVNPAGNYQRLLELYRHAAPDGYRIVRKPHVAFFDMYFDSPDLALARNGAYLRARFDDRSFHKHGKYKLFFKDNARPPEGEQALRRREVRSDLTRRELMQYRHGALTGQAAELAYDIVVSRDLVPICVISTFRRYFTMRGPLSDIMMLGMEQSSAFSAADFDAREVLETGVIDAPVGCSRYDFELCEFEVTVENDETANAAFGALTNSIDREFEIPSRSKYESCLSELGIVTAPRTKVAWRVQVAGGIMVRTDKSAEPDIALVYRKRFDDWAIPKGKVRGGESHAEAALREVREETGFMCRLGPEVGCLHYVDIKGQPKTAHYWMMHPVDGGFAPHAEIDDLRWFDFDTAAKMAGRSGETELIVAVGRNIDRLLAGEEVDKVEIVEED